MRQVPYYLIIGNGRLARHFSYYFQQLNLPFSAWNRQEPFEKLQAEQATATHVLLLIADKAIEPFILAHFAQSHALLIHCSGALVTKHAYGAHPLMTFGNELYEKACYSKIPFVLDHDAPDFETLFPGLSNPAFRLDKKHKAKYHALCVLSGNFSCLLWQKLIETMEAEFQLPPVIVHDYMEQQCRNMMNDPQKALTGPLVRNDQETIRQNIEALTDDPFQPVYQSFIDCYQQLKGGNEQ